MFYLKLHHCVYLISDTGSGIVKNFKQSVFDLNIGLTPTPTPIINTYNHDNVIKGYVTI